MVLLNKKGITLTSQTIVNTRVIHNTEKAHYADESCLLVSIQILDKVWVT